MAQMDYAINHINSTGSFVVKTSGRMNADDYIAMAKDILAHPRHRPDGNVIFDHIELDFTDVRVEELQRIRSFHKKNEGRIGSGRSAIVVKKGSLEKWHKLWSHGEKLKTGNAVRVFEDHNDAVSWITA